jgi:hypothetical protein
MKMPDFSKAKIGDRVWSFRNGWGEIKEISLANTDFPIGVKFKEAIDKYEIYFCKDGRYYVDDVYPELHWDEVKFVEPPAPKQVDPKEIIITNLEDRIKGKDEEIKDLQYELNEYKELLKEIKEKINFTQRVSTVRLK